MYKPAKIREFITPAVHQKPKTQTQNSRTQKGPYTAVGTVRGKFKQKGTAETTANGLTVVNDKTTFITYYKKVNPFEAKDILTINGVDYEIIGTPENVEMRGLYAVLNLEKISGGA